MNSVGYGLLADMNWRFLGNEVISRVVCSFHKLDYTCGHCYELNVVLLAVLYVACPVFMSVTHWLMQCYLEWPPD